MKDKISKDMTEKKTTQKDFSITRLPLFMSFGTVAGFAFGVVTAGIQDAGAIAAGVTLGLIIGMFAGLYDNIHASL